jgi:hypothetical protein
MNPRHAAALALVGWYLIEPPALATNQNVPDLTAPLSRWTVKYKAQAAADCEKRRSLDNLLALDPDFRQYAEITARQKGEVFSAQKLIDFVMPQACIASHDPRLKEK